MTVMRDPVMEFLHAWARMTVGPNLYRIVKDRPFFQSAAYKSQAASLQVSNQLATSIRRLVWSYSLVRTFSDQKATVYID